MNSTVQTSEGTPKGRKKLSDEAIRAKKFARTLKQVKRAVLEVQLLLLDGVEKDAQLHAAGALLTQSEYGDVITERAIVKVCGFTRCGNALTTENTRKGRYRISLSAKKVYDLQEASQFCCSDCLIASREFGNKLPAEREALTSQETATETLKLVRGSQYQRPRLPRTRPSKDTRSSTRDALKDIKPGETAAHSNINPNSADFGDAYKEGNDKDCDLATSSSNPKCRNPQGEASDNLASSTRENSYCVKSGKETMDPGEVKTSGLNSSNLGLRSVNAAHGGIATSSSNFDLTSTVMTSSGKVDHGSSSFDPTATNTRISLPQVLAHSKEKSAPVEIQKQAGRTSLEIQERAHDGKVLPIFDYSGPSDAIEGYVPVKSRSLLASGAEQPVGATVSSNQAEEVGGEFASTSGDKQAPTMLENKFKRTEALKEAREPIQVGSGTGRRPTNGGEVCKEWAGLVSVDAVASSVNACVGIVEEHGIGCPSSSSSNLIITGEDKDSANLKPALKKQLGRQNYGRNVSWLDQNVDQVDSLIEESSTTEKAAPVSKKVASTKEKVKSSRVKPALTAVNASISSTSTPKEPLLDLVKAVESETISVNRTESSKQDVEEQEFNKTVESNLEAARALRLASAEAIAAALTKAATATAAGEIDGVDAVASAGISILSASHNSNSATSATAGEGKEENIDMSEDGEEGGLGDDELYERALRASGGEPRWPRTQTIDDEDEDGDGDDADFEYGDEGFEGAHEVGFDPAPKGFKAEVSMFGTMYMALDRWISAATVAHIYGKEPHEQDMFLSVDGREYGWQVVIGDGVSAEILRTFSICLSRAIPEVVRVLRLPVPMSTLEQALGRLVKTFSFVDPLPPFGTKHWRMVAVLLLDALSVQKLPLLGAHLSNNRAVFRKVLESTGTSEAEYDTFRDLVLPLGRLLSFSMLSGG